MKRTGVGVLVLVLGILSWVGLGCLTGIPAWIVGNNALRDIDRGYVDENDRGMVQAGRILGMLNTVIGICVVGIWLVFAAGIVGAGVTQGHR